MTFREKIASLRKEASEAQSASKIIDKLKALKDNNSPDTAYRWIWELIQNAKDVVNTSGLVDIEIAFSETNKTIEFRHNGRLFTTENIVFLIEQVSSKERLLTDKIKNKSTGKFGTGFLTTHLLSEKVQIHGYIQDEGENPRSFKTLLDRTGQDKASIMKAISDSCDMLDNGTECAVDETQMNTKFIYELDEIGITTAISGLRNLLVSIPYVFAFVQELNTITVITDKFRRIIKRGRKVPVELESAIVTHVRMSTTINDEETIEDRYVFMLSDDSISIAVEIEIRNSEKHLLKPNEKLPRIFCDFPLLGTNDFAFPVVVNSPMFNPTEPRDGIPLVHSAREGGDSSENKSRITNAIPLYNALLDYFAMKGYKDLYNIVRVAEQPEKYWLDAAWVEQELIQPIKEHIKTTAFIHNSLGQVCSLYDGWGNPNIFILKDGTPEFRNKIWELSNCLMPAMMTTKDEIEHWYGSLWEDCHNFGIIDLILKVEECGDITTLESQLKCKAMPWLNDLITLFYYNSGIFITELERNPSILPNQRGTFLSLDKVYHENSIGDTYKNIALLAGIDFRERLLDNRIERTYLKGLQEINLNNVFSEIRQAQLDNDASVELYKSIINLRVNKNDKQLAFIEIARCLYPDAFSNPIRVPYLSDRLLSEALKFWREKICADFCECTNIDGAIARYSFAGEQAVAAWISALAEHLKNCENDNLLDKYAVLPNQHGTFMCKSEVFLDDGSIDEILKDASMYTGDDVRAKMLFEGIPLDLPPNRVVSLENVAQAITSFVRSNNKSISKLGRETWETFRNTSIWIRNHRKDARVNKCFKELIDNFHWFYDDEEIAESITRSEQYDEILKKYNIADIKELVTILQSHSIAGAKESETISISKELLAQWGITSEEELRRALEKNVFGSAQIHRSSSSPELFDYVKKILDRAKTNIINYLYLHDDYELDKDNIQFIANTIFRVRKLGHEIYVIARPSDFEHVILYYDTEIDLLDFDKDCELWVENGVDPVPQKITLGRILKLTGINKIPLRSLKNAD